ncbi:MAG: hypothetical protein ABIH04_01335, partial [Planctomycetota bacterium]
AIVRFFILALFALIFCVPGREALPSDWKEVPLRERVEEADLVVAGKITKVENATDGNSEIAVGTITVGEVLKGDKNTKEAKLVWYTGRVLDPETGQWSLPRQQPTGVRIQYKQGQEGIWLLKATLKNPALYRANYPGYPITATEEKLKEIKGYVTQKYEHKEIPAKPVNGLLFEIRLLNKYPLYPGDDLRVEYRLTNVQEKGEIQLVDFGFMISLNPKAIGPAGEKIAWPVILEILHALKCPTAILKPGAFYGGKLDFGFEKVPKPGEYSLYSDYNNVVNLKNFDCRMGNVPSNTVIFEVADVDAPAVNDIKMLVRMTKGKYKQGEPVIAEVRFYNAGKEAKEIYLPNGLLLKYYSRGEIKDEKGMVVKWRQIKFVRAPDVKYGQLAPGKAFIREYDLREVCNLPPGKYIFQLQGGFPKPGKMTANVVTFETVS